MYAEMKARENQTTKDDGKDDLDKMFANTDRSYIVEDGGEGQFPGEDIQEKDNKHGPKKKVLIVHDDRRLILFRHFTEALFRCAYLKHNRDTTQVIQNCENMFNN